MITESVSTCFLQSSNPHEPQFSRSRKCRYTYEVAPVFTLLEREIIERALGLVGYPGMPEADGILSPGGSLSNMYGMVLARYKYFPEAKRRGMSGLPPLALFTSEDGHYSITKGAHWLGLGTDNIVKAS